MTMTPIERKRAVTRRTFLRGSSGFLGAAALGSLARGADGPVGPHFPAKAKRVIYLCQAGAPSQLELFDPKPRLLELDGQPMPESLVAGDTVNDQLRGRRLIAAGSRFRFERHGESGHELSELLPHTARIADRISVVRSMQTDVLNHDPALTMLQTGHSAPGRPSMGAWASYGLGSDNRELPDFTVLVSRADGFVNPVNARLWGSAFLPGRHQGVELRTGKDPVLFLSDPDGLPRTSRRMQVDALGALNGLRAEETGDPAIRTRIAAYELAYRMQESVPELMDVSDEAPETLELYGATPGEPSYANNCLLARRLAERGVRFIQLYHKGWDHHYQLPSRIRELTAQTDRASAALVLDLERRGMLDETLVVWGGEFGRSPMNQGGLGGDSYGRDHWGKAFSVWLAGGGVKPGVTIGETDELGYDVVRDPVDIHDLHATVLHLMGIDHEELAYRSRGRDFRLTDVAGYVVDDLLA
ncbi:MAG: DUF1501 domain-containing protein [Planctomycetota bacterium]